MAPGSGPLGVAISACAKLTWPPLERISLTAANVAFGWWLKTYVEPVPCTPPCGGVTCSIRLRPVSYTHLREVRPAAITLDVFMPGMDGWAVLSALKMDPGLAEVPVILLTISEDRGRACLLGAAEFLQKPVEPECLVAALQKFFLDELAGPVLVVDDDPASRDLAARVLKRHFLSLIHI